MGASSKRHRLSERDLSLSIKCHTDCERLPHRSQVQVPHQMASEKQNSLRFKQLEKQVRKVLSLPGSGNSTKSGKIVLREGPYQENSIAIPFRRSSTYASCLNQVEIWFNRISPEENRVGERIYLQSYPLSSLDGLPFPPAPPGVTSIINRVAWRPRKCLPRPP